MITSDKVIQEPTIKQDEFVSAMLSESSIAAAARAVKIGDATARRWLKLPHIQDALRTRKQDKYNESLQLLQSGVGTALKTLHYHMTCEDTPAAQQIRAAQIWLEQSIELYKMTEIEAKITDLETLMASHTGK